MIQVEKVEELIRAKLTDAQIEVVDTTGTMNHFQVSVVSGEFAGKMLIDQHRLVQAALQEAIDDGRIHAVSIKTSVPS